MRPDQIKLGEKIFFNCHYDYLNYKIEGTVTKIAGTRFQVRPVGFFFFLSQWYHKWLDMENCQLYGEVKE